MCLLITLDDWRSTDALVAGVGNVVLLYNFPYLQISWFGHDTHFLNVSVATVSRAVDCQVLKRSWSFLAAHLAESLWAPFSPCCRGARSLDEQWFCRTQPRTKAANCCSNRKRTATTAPPHSLPNATRGCWVMNCSDCSANFCRAVTRRSDVARVQLAPPAECCATSRSRQVEYRICCRVLSKELNMHQPNALLKSRHTPSPYHSHNAQPVRYTFCHKTKR